jgi:GT2 family glycosyltransferase/SAM-dependent methyltransferase
VIPLYNYDQYIEEALDSVCAQTLAELDLVVVDDCSTDRSLTVARRWLEANSQRFCRGALLRNSQNSGLALSRNAGFAHAEAPFLMALDADNVLLADCVRRCLEQLRSTGAAVAYPTIRTFGGAERFISDVEWSAAQFACGNYVDAMALIRKAAWAAVGGYEHVRHGWEDYDLWCKFAEHGLWGVHVPEVLALYRAHDASMTRRQTNQPAHWRELIDRFERRYPWLDLSGPDLRAKDARPVGENEPGTLDVAPATILPLPRAPSDVVEVGASTTAPRHHDDARMEELLAILRCPSSGERLVRSGDRLSNTSRSCHWPIQNGRPVLFPGLGSVAERPIAHVSNTLPARAVAIIDDTAGPVLNLGAGGTERWFPNVVEVEAGIFRNTDVIADAHRLPFVDGAFAAVVTLNAFEHFHDPLVVAAEIRRVLQPNGTLFVHTAFMQPLHEPPWHFYNCTKYGLLRWFENFETLDITVSENFHPAYSISWLSHELEQAVRKHMSAGAEREFAAMPVGRFAEFWRQPTGRVDPVWQMLSQLPQEAQEFTAAGFEFVGRRPALDI